MTGHTLEMWDLGGEDVRILVDGERSILLEECAELNSIVVNKDATLSVTLMFEKVTVGSKVY